VAENAARLGERSFAVSFHGAGEPTLAWDTYSELVAYARAKAGQMGLKAALSTCTNGVMSEARARWLAHNTDAASVSLDGLPPHQNRLRPKRNGDASYEEVHRTLKTFDETGFHYSIGATITPDNVRQMSDMVRHFTEQFRAADLQFDPLLVSGRCCSTGCGAPLDTEYAEEFMRAFTVAQERRIPLGFSILSLNSLKTFYCCSVSEGFTVTHDGWVTSCFESCGPTRPFAEVFLYGRYDPDQRRFSLDLEKLKALRKRHVHNLAACRNCFCKYMCCGDCPMHSLRMKVGFERGARCELTRRLARHRLASQLGLTGNPKDFAPLESVACDDSLAGFTGPIGPEKPWVYEMQRWHVHESNYMKAPPDDQSARLLISKGNGQYRQKQYGKALDLYEAAIEAKPKDPMAHNNRGLALHKVGRLEEAVRSFDRAIELDPGGGDYYLNLGKVQSAMGRLDEALSAFETAQRLSPGKPAALFNKVWVLLERREMESAAAALRELSQMDGQPRNVMLLAQTMATLASRSPKPVDIWFPAGHLPSESKWLFEFNRSLATGGLEELVGEVRSSLLAAMLAFSTEQYTVARRHLVKATGEGCRSPLPFWLEGMAWQAEGNKELADAALKKAVDLQPWLSWGSLEPQVQLYIDGALQGTTPRQLRLLPGAHLLRYAKNGAQPQQEIICLRSGEKRHLRFPPSNGSEQLREEAATMGESKTPCLL
jgi:radical SAM protein with 4Fe4S-binding SPASM domain